MADTRRGYRPKQEDDDQSWDKPSRPISRHAHEVGYHSGRNMPTPSSRRSAEEEWHQRQVAGIQALLELSVPVMSNPAITVPLFIGTKQEGSRSLLKDPAVRGAAALMLSVGATGGLSYVFWAYIAHQQNAAAVGKISAEVSTITFLATVGSLNLTSIFGRFLPVAGWHARRLMAAGYGSAGLVGLLAALIFLATPLASGLVIGGGLGALAFVSFVILNSVFNIQDGGLIGFGRFGWIPAENVSVALLRFALLPVSALLLSAQASVLAAWLVPMALAVFIVNVFNLGPLARGRMRQRPRLPVARELSRLVAVGAISGAVNATVSIFLPAFVTHRLGSVQGGYFYVPWMVTTMVALLMGNITTSMVREVVANPQKAAPAIRRSLGLAGLGVIAVMIVCLLLAGLILAPLGSSFVSHGSPLMRWTGLAMPATTVIVFFWALCSIHKRPWPSFGVNVFTAAATFGGILLLHSGSDISSVGMIYCAVQWAAALLIVFPTFTGLRAIARRKRSRRQ